jgi:hypothetical protein
MSKFSSSFAKFFGSCHSMSFEDSVLKTWSQNIVVESIDRQKKNRKDSLALKL